MAVGSPRHAPAALPPRKTPVPTCIGGWIAPGPVWTDAKNLAPIGIRSTDRPALSKSLYRISYPDPQPQLYLQTIYFIVQNVSYVSDF